MIDRVPIVDEQKAKRMRKAGFLGRPLRNFIYFLLSLFAAK